MAQSTLETVLVILSFLLSAVINLISSNSLRDAINGMRADMRVLLDRTTPRSNE